MVGNTNILSLAQSNNLFALQKTTRQIAETQLKLATGKRVNSALDNPQNFFTSLSLSSRASSLSRVLDGIGQGLRSLQEANNGLQGLESIINLAKTTLNNAKADLLSNQQDIGALILADNPDIYYRLNETSGTTAINLGTAGPALNGTYQSGVTLNTGTLHFGEDNASVSFDGTNDYIALPNHVLINTDGAGYPERTVELTFKATDTNGRQVLFEEGGTGNAFSLYLDGDKIYFAARDAGDFGPFNISATIESGETYHAAFVFDSASSTFTGYLNGQAVGTGIVTKDMNAHGANVAIGRNSGGTYFHDGANSGDGEYFLGKISDFALYNSVLSASDLQDRYNAMQLEEAKVYEEQVSKIISQIDPFVQDSSYRGINLLNKDSLITQFNPSGSSNLKTQGQDLTSSGLGIGSLDFKDFSGIDKAINQFDIATDKFRTFGNSISSDLNILKTREDYTEKTINTHKAGSDDLTRADLNEEAANLLALQTQQTIQISTLALSASNSRIADLLSRSFIKN